MNAGLVVEIPWGGMDIQTLLYAKNSFKLFALTGGRDTKITDATACVQEPPVWNFHNIYFFEWYPK